MVSVAVLMSVILGAGLNVQAKLALRAFDLIEVEQHLPRGNSYDVAVLEGFDDAIENAPAGSERVRKRLDGVQAEKLFVCVVQSTVLRFSTAQIRA